MCHHYARSMSADHIRALTASGVQGNAIRHAEYDGRFGVGDQVKCILWTTRKKKAR